ncbi:hypothetical protein [Burkholderia vietnamiensis]|jgi:hypothetical protein|uniref:hypothetical protein n=1 Tax=Burkholderia vietnamiensis TaxID=60552 RepID=UPI001CF1B17F|nr:hypothetical protein [Burkholderia vietnamiensis]MCA8198365.1 hypothetical protein [Burkholderia vietnamiensis]
MEDSQNVAPAWPFRATGKGKAIAATTASQSVTIAAGERLEGAFVANLSQTSWAWIAFGQGGATATFPTPGNDSPGVPLAPNSSMTVRPPNEPKDASAQEAVYDTVAAVLQSGTGTILITPGLGT